MVPVSAFFWDIPYLNPKAKERVGYPTQKPIILLERIIELVTNKGDLVLDPFCGSGTTCIAAKLLDRNYIGIDISKEAVILTNDRLENPIKTTSNLLKNGRNSYVNVDKNALNLLNGIDLNPVQRNRGIDAILTELYENTPILVRVQKDNETIEDSFKLLLKAMKTKRSKRSFLIQTILCSDNNASFKLDEGIIIIDSPTLQIQKQLMFETQK